MMIHFDFFSPENMLKLKSEFIQKKLSQDMLNNGLSIIKDCSYLLGICLKLSLFKKNLFTWLSFQFLKYYLDFDIVFFSVYF